MFSFHKELTVFSHTATRTHARTHAHTHTHTRTHTRTHTHAHAHNPQASIFKTMFPDFITAKEVKSKMERMHDVENRKLDSYLH